MAAATCVADLALGFAAKMTEVLEAVPELTAEEVSVVIRTCRFLRDLFTEARRSAEAALAAGACAQAFAAKYENTVADLDATLRIVERMLTQARTNPLPALTEELVSNYQSLRGDLTGFRQFLGEALAKVKTPVRPIDWKRIQEAETAYARGETKPFQRLAKKPAGE
jgi:hypothetical protein